MTATDELTALQGTWRMISGESGGLSLPGAMAKNFNRVWRGDEIVVTNGSSVVMRANITLDPSQRPKAIDYRVTEGASRGRTELGIYSLDGDTFTSCLAKPGNRRPTGFRTTFGDGRTLSVWKRESDQQQ
jgi:uncharacterized protein (TIGR03067 family)